MINTHLRYVKIRELAKILGMKLNKLQELLVSLGVIEQHKHKYKRPYLLTGEAVRLRIGEIRYRPYNVKSKAPYNIYYVDKISYVLDRNVSIVPKKQVVEDEPETLSQSTEIVVDISQPPSNTNISDVPKFVNGRKSSNRTYDNFSANNLGDLEDKHWESYHFEEQNLKPLSEWDW